MSLEQGNTIELTRSCPLTEARRSVFYEGALPVMLMSCTGLSQHVLQQRFKHSPTTVVDIEMLARHFVASHKEAAIPLYDMLGTIKPCAIVGHDAHVVLTLNWR